MNLHHVTIEEVASREGEGPWWIAHDHPERPHDDFVIWSWDCEKCMMHLIATAHQAPGSVAHYVTAWEVVPSTIAHTLDSARQWRAEQGLLPL